VRFPCPPDHPDPPVLRQWYFYNRDGGPWLYISGGRVPDAGDSIRVTYTAAHTLAGLDGAPDTTPPAVHFALLQNGAAGKAAALRSLQLVETYGRKTDEPQMLKTWSEALLADFAGELRALKTSQSLRESLADGWRLDRWDS